jgi:hypothetical protein
MLTTLPIQRSLKTVQIKGKTGEYKVVAKENVRCNAPNLPQTPVATLVMTLPDFVRTRGAPPREDVFPLGWLLLRDRPTDGRRGCECCDP